MIRNKSVLFAFRLIVGGLFITLGSLRLPILSASPRTSGTTGSFPQEICFFTALILPWLEVLAGACLITGIFKKTGALLISGMLAFFIVLVAVTMIRGIDVECGCFGTFSRKADWRLILEDLIMLVMSLGVALSYPPKKSAG